MSYRSFTGDYKSYKMDREYPFESFLERDAMVLLDADPEIAEFSCQPETFVWRDGSVRHSYTPDILLIRTDATREYREIKPKKVYVADPSLSGRKDHISFECKERMATFLIWKEADIRWEPRLSNAKLLKTSVSRLNRQSYDNVWRAIELLSFPLSIAELRSSLRNCESQFLAFLGLVALGEFQLDITQPLSSPDLKISRVKRTGLIGPAGGISLCP